MSQVLYSSNLELLLQDLHQSGKIAQTLHPIPFLVTGNSKFIANNNLRRILTVQVPLKLGSKNYK